mmetsp:Transcript_15951/g.62324  ORF Transcript_15951/g.62324 Transcript_15951/m.62324 type:complete len:213 (-) Transcript_15951:183-821(-)
MAVVTATPPVVPASLPSTPVPPVASPSLAISLSSLRRGGCSRTAHAAAHFRVKRKNVLLLRCLQGIRIEHLLVNRHRNAREEHVKEVLLFHHPDHEQPKRHCRLGGNEGQLRIVVDERLKPLPKALRLAAEAQVEHCHRTDGLAGVLEHVLELLHSEAQREQLEEQAHARGRRARALYPRINAHHLLADLLHHFMVRLEPEEFLEVRARLNG